MTERVFLNKDVHPDLKTWVFSFHEVEEFRLQLENLLLKYGKEHDLAIGCVMLMFGSSLLTVTRLLQKISQDDHVQCLKESLKLGTEETILLYGKMRCVATQSQSEQHTPLGDPSSENIAK